MVASWKAKWRPVNDPLPLQSRRIASIDSSRRLKRVRKGTPIALNCASVAGWGSLRPFRRSGHVYEPVQGGELVRQQDRVAERGQQRRGAEGEAGRGDGDGG